MLPQSQQLSDQGRLDVAVLIQPSSARDNTSRVIRVAAITDTMSDGSKLIRIARVTISPIFMSDFRVQL
jgi:hypothetical protein